MISNYLIPTDSKRWVLMAALNPTMFYQEYIYLRGLVLCCFFFTLMTLPNCHYPQPAKLCCMLMTCCCIAYSMSPMALTCSFSRTPLLSLIVWLYQQPLILCHQKQVYDDYFKNFHASLPTQLTIRSSETERVGSYMYLGILISSNISFTSLIKSVCSKARNWSHLLLQKLHVVLTQTWLSQLLDLYTIPHYN